MPLVFGLLVQLYLTHDGDAIGREINTVGRERILSLAIRDEDHPEEAEQVLAILRGNADALLHGGTVRLFGSSDTLTVGPARTPAIASAVVALQARVDALGRASAASLAADAGPAEQEELFAAAAATIEAANAVIKELDAHNAMIQARNNAALLLILGLAVAVAGALSWSARRTWGQVVVAEESARARADALGRSEAINRAVLGSVTDGIIVTDEHGLVLSFNPAAERLFGYAAAQVVGKDVHTLMPEAQLAAHDGRHVEGLRNDGSRFPLALGVSETQVGERRLFASVLRDLSEQHRVKADLARSEAFNRAVLDSAVDGILVIDDAGLIQSLNPAAERMFGWSSSEIAGKSLNILIPDSNHRVHHLGIGREVEAVRKDGSTFPMELAMSEMRVGDRRLFAGVTRDISAMKAAHRDLAEKNAELQAASRIDRISSRVMLAFNRQQESSSAQQVLDVLTDEAAYRPLAFYVYDEWQGHLRLTASANLPASHVAGTVRLGEGLVGGAAARREAVIVDAPGDSAFALDTGVGRLNPETVFAIPLTHGEKLLGVLSGASMARFGARERSWITQVAGQVAIGLHAQLQYQELKLLSEQLNERSQRITEQNRELERANQLKSQFLANMSHELRTPLNAIIGFSEVLKDGVLGELPAEQLDYVSEIHQSGKHLLSLINDILDLSKIESGKMELDLEPTALGPVLDNAITLLKERAAKEGVALSKAVAPDLGDIDADGRKLRQIVYNLLSNAVKFTPSGGAVRLEASVVGDVVEIAVVDTGIGIAANDLAKLFRPFEQLDGDIDRRYEGTGLGLAMVKSLVELHGGTLGVESALGRGSRFWVHLPRLSALHAKAAELQVASDGQRPTVLAIDPDTDALGVIRRWLEQAGYRFDAVTTVDLACGVIREHSPDLLLLDVSAGDDTPWELLARLKSRCDSADVPVILMSAAADHQRGITLGAFEVIEKPVTIERLEALITKLRGGSGPGRTDVLLVDDDPRAVEHVAKRLEDAGFAVGRAYGGKDALAMLAAHNYALVILDLMMPEVTGFDVLREMRLREETAGTPVVVLTAKVLTADERSDLERSVSAVLEKGTWNEKDFLRQVRGSLLRGRQSRPVPPTRFGAARVLVVDDEPSARDVLRLYLTDAGFEVETVDSVAEALRRIEARRPDLVTLDLRMPDADGVAFLGALARTGISVPVVMVSGAEVPAQLRALGASAVLAKPVQRSDLLALARRLTGAGVPGARPLVLVADDDPRAIKVVTSFFANEPFEVVTAFGGQDAIDHATRRRPDLVVVDLMMPDVTGFDVIDWLRRTPETRSVPIVVLTAKQLGAAEESMLRDHAAHVFAKTATGRDEFLAEVWRALGRAPGAAAPVSGS